MATTISGAKITVGEADLTTPLAVSDGGTGSSTAQIVEQIAYVQDGAYSNAGSTLTPHDNTIPQITEGNEVMTLPITPKSATNILKIDVAVNVGHTVANSVGTVALHQDAVADALMAVSASNTQGDTIAVPTTFTYMMVAGTTSTTTFRIRIGDTANQIYFNGGNAAGDYGGVCYSSIIITEYSA